MKQDVVITVFGKIENAGTIQALVGAAAEEGSVDWEGGLDEYEAFVHLCSCSEDGKPFTLTRQDTNILFDEVTAVCKEHGLSYVMNMGDTGCEGFSALQSWAPGMVTDFISSCDDDEVQVALSDVKKASGTGIEAVRELVSRLETMTLSNVRSRRISVGEEAKNEFLAKDAAMP